MTRIVSLVAFALGAIVVLWMSSSFINDNGLALLVCILIATAYTAGFVELLRYQKATESLQHAIAGAPRPVRDLSTWLSKVDPSLRFSVQQRIYGEATGLPAPLLTPYLVGLLVMLGLLGTFVGMVETLQGAVGALQGNTELEAVREGLAAPIQGLGMAFATSVAGITASAMLGLISTFCRRQRVGVSRLLDAEMGGALKEHSLTYQRRQTYDALQAQSAALPAVAEQLGVMARQLSDSQQNLQRSLAEQYQQLSKSVESSLQEGFRDSGRLAAESAQPILQSFMDGLASESRVIQKQLGETVAQQLSAIGDKLEQTGDTLQQQWQQAQDIQQKTHAELLGKIEAHINTAQSQFSEAATSLLGDMQKTNSNWLAQQQENEHARLEQLQTAFNQSAVTLAQTTEDFSARIRDAATGNQNDIARLMAQSEALLEAYQQRENNWQNEAAQRLEDLIKAASSQLEALRHEEQQRGDAAVARLAELQEASSKQLASLGEALEGPMTRLIETASDAPRAAAEVIEQLRGEISKNIERDNNLLEERQRTLSQLDTLSASLEQNARLQREAVQALLDGSSEHLAIISREFSEKVAAESSAIGEQMAHFSASAAELSALADVFNTAIQQFGETNSQLMARLEQIEATLANAGKRSDEQMEYYLTQAREIIDHNLLSNQELLFQMQAQIPNAKSAKGN